MCTGDILLGGQPCDELASRPRGSSNTPMQLLAAETDISSGRLGLWLVCTFTLFLPFLCTQSVPRVRKIRAIFFKIFLRWPSFQLSLQKDNTRKAPSKIRDIKLQ